MAGTLQPLDQQFAIVDSQGRPTEYFIRWAQQKQIEIGDSITLADLQAYLTEHSLREGTGIQFTPSGDLNESPQIAADVQEILDELSATRGAVIFRGLLGWQVLLPGTSGFFLQTAGAGADPVWAAGGGGGVARALGCTDLTTAAAPSVNFTLMRMHIADANFTIAKIAFQMTAAVATTKFQVFVYAGSVAGLPGALLGSSALVTGVAAGYNEIALTAPVAITKGTLIWVGATVTAAAFANLWNTGVGRGGFVANGGVTVPPNPAPGGLTINASTNYGFWAVA